VAWLGALLGAAVAGVATEAAALGCAEVVPPSDEQEAAPTASKARPANDPISVAARGARRVVRAAPSRKYDTKRLLISGSEGVRDVLCGQRRRRNGARVIGCVPSRARRVPGDRPYRLAETRSREWRGC